MCVVHRGSSPSASDVLKEEEIQEDAEENSGAHSGANDHEALTVFIVAMVLAVDVRQIYHQYFEETAQKNMPLAKAMKKHARVHCIAGIGAASREVMAAACVLGCDVVVCDDNTNTTRSQRDFTQWVQEQRGSDDVASLSRKLRGIDDEASDNEPIDEDDMESFAIKEPEEKSSDEDDTPLARLQKKPKEARHTGGGKVAQAVRIAAKDKKNRNEKAAAKDTLLQRHAAATAAAKKRKKTTVGNNSSSEEEWVGEDPAATKQKKTKAPKPRRSDGDSSDGDNSDEAFQSIKPKYPKKTAHKAG
jgi:hypothetical protein